MTVDFTLGYTSFVHHGWLPSFDRSTWENQFAKGTLFTLNFWKFEVIFERTTQFIVDG